MREWERSGDGLELAGQCEQLGDLLHRSSAGGAELVDDFGGGGHRDFHGFGERCFGGESGGEVGGDGISGPDDIDLTSEGERGHVSGSAGGRGADDASFGERYESSAAVGLGGFERLFFDLFDGSSGFASDHGTKFGQIHFVGDGRETFEATSAIGDDEDLRELDGEFFDFGEERTGDNAGLGGIDLVHNNQSIQSGHEGG